MAQTVQLKRSALSGKVPGTGSLNLGELALNTYDGKIFFRRSGSTDTVQEVITTNVVNTGSIFLTGAITASIAATNGVVSGSSQIIGVLTSLNAFSASENNKSTTLGNLTGSYATTGSNSFKADQQITGSLGVSGDITVLGSINARQFNIGIISSSIMYTSGSNKFGDTGDDVMQVTGSLQISGSQIITGSVNVTGSLYVNGVAVGGASNSGSFTGSFTGSFIGDGSGLRGVVSDDIPRDGWDYNANSSASISDFNAESDKYHIDFAQSQSTEVGTPVGYKGFLTNVSGSTQILPTLDGIDFVVGNNVVASIGVGGIIATVAAGTVSGSSQVVSILSSLNTYTGSNDTTNTAQNTRLTTIESVTGSYEIMGRSIVSGSSQITFSGISSLPTLVSGSSQITPLLPTGTVSGSIQVLGGTGIISSSTQLENATITNLTITNLTTVNETASVIFSSGSNRFGDFGDDVHSFTGSVKISGSITTIGTSTATAFSGAIAATNGVVSGSSQIDVMSTTNITRLATTGSNTFSGSQTISGSKLELHTSDANGGIVVNSKASTSQTFMTFLDKGTNDNSTVGTFVDINGANALGGLAIVGHRKDNQSGLVLRGQNKVANSNAVNGYITSVIGNAYSDNALTTLTTGVTGKSISFLGQDTELANLNFNGDLTITNGNLVVASGKGIDFSATSNGSGTSTSELLNDYEEGTWTPSFGGAGTPSYTTQFGRYTKIGNMVYCTIALRATSISGGSTIQISGLPFSAGDASDTGQRATYAPRLGGHINGVTETTARFRVAGNYMDGVKGDTTTTYMTAAEFCSGGSAQITGNFWYYA